MSEDERCGPLNTPVRENGDLESRIGDLNHRWVECERTNGAGPKGPSEDKCWALILAGGFGRRMRRAVLDWFGTERPKQYCAFTGTRSMIEHTWDRAARIVPPERIVTVASAAHRNYMENQRQRGHKGAVLYQPEDRGTTASVYLGLSHILVRDRSAIVLILPSDHFIHPANAFTSLACRVIDLVRKLEDRIIILGAEADGPDQDCGWIRLGREAESTEEREVSSFYEKPSGVQAERLYREGALLSTMIITARAETLWKIASRHLGGSIFDGLNMIRRLQRLHYRGLVSMDHVTAAVSYAYRTQPASDFSTDILQSCVHLWHVVPMGPIDWRDWGRPERVRQTLDQYGLKPAFENEIPGARQIFRV